MTVTRVHLVATDWPVIAHIVERDAEGRYAKSSEAHLMGAGDAACFYIAEGQDVLVRQARIVAHENGANVLEGTGGHKIGAHPSVRLSHSAPPAPIDLGPIHDKPIGGASGVSDEPHPPQGEQPGDA